MQCNIILAKKELFFKKVKELEKKSKKVLKENRLPKDPTIDPQFGVPEQKKYPLYDEKHVKSAIKLFGHVDPAYERQLAMAIIAKMKTYDIPYRAI